MIVRPFNQQAARVRTERGPGRVVDWGKEFLKRVDGHASATLPGAQEKHRDTLAGRWANNLPESERSEVLTDL